MNAVARLITVGRKRSLRRRSVGERYGAKTARVGPAFAVKKVKPIGMEQSGYTPPVYTHMTGVQQLVDEMTASLTQPTRSKRSPYVCSKCGMAGGHNARKCPNPKGLPEETLHDEIIGGRYV